MRRVRQDYPISLWHASSTQKQ